MSALISKIKYRVFKKLRINKIYEPESNVAFYYDLIASINIAFWIYIYSMHLFFMS